MKVKKSKKKKVVPKTSSWVENLGLSTGYIKLNVTYTDAENFSSAFYPSLLLHSVIDVEGAFTFSMQMSNNIK